jgi:hypothetical protein
MLKFVKNGLYSVEDSKVALRRLEHWTSLVGRPSEVPERLFSGSLELEHRCMMAHWTI